MLWGSCPVPRCPCWDIHTGGSEEEPGCLRQGQGWIRQGSGVWGAWPAGANGQVLRPAGLGRPLLEERGSA